MKGPARPAPSVPRRGVNRYSPVTNWNDDPFGADVFEHLPQFTQKKKPPPRPPSPKLRPPDAPLKPSHFIRRPTVLSSLLSRNKNNKHAATSQADGALSNPLATLKLEDTHKMFLKCDVKPVVTGALIDLSSPPSSPSFTTRSSSDGLSVDSFGSDATPSTSRCHLPGSASQAESGFEDDCDLFKQTPLEDFSSVDPFSPTPVMKPPVVKKSALYKDMFHDSSNVGVAPLPATKGPTIIRAKPARPKPPNNLALLKTTFNSNFPVTSMNVNTTMPLDKVRNGLVDNGVINTFKPLGHEAGNESPLDWDEDSSPERDVSPPMPSIPPPPPPSEAEPELGEQEPCAIALYDYSTGHPDDLCFKKNDKIKLLRRVDGEWLYGQLHSGAQGLFPATYIQVEVPLAGESPREPRLGTATALYDMRPQLPTDLPFAAGDTIVVLRWLSGEWCFGECNGHRGQFPANYVQMH